MASWKRFFSNVPSNLSPMSGGGFEGSTSANAPNRNFVSFLPEVYAGPPNRIERYAQYEDMDRDPVINAALNTVAEFCTQENDYTKLPFTIQFTNDDATESEKKALEETLRKWSYLNDFKTRLYYIVRKTLIYGDCFFVRDPETFEWEYVDPKNVEKVVVDELKGKDPEAYFIRDLDLNLTAKVMTTQKIAGQYFVPSGVPTPGNPNYPGQNTWSQPSSTSRFTKASHTEEVPGEHIVHLSLNTGMEPFWPFGNSILEPVFKAYKQKQLLEDAMVIYRVQRAPERRVFYIDVGTLPSHKAMAYVERVKNEIQQRRIPSRTGGGSQIMDASYNPLSILEDYYFPVNDQGKGSKVELLPGGADLGTINDLLYFNNQLIRGLGVPSSYLPTGPDDSPANFNDGKLGVAFIQELRFANFCKRIQTILIENLDYEFKLFCKHTGIVIESSEFQLGLEEPESFSEYRMIEKDTAHFNVMAQAFQMGTFSKRFVMRRFGGLTEAEILENEKLWREENKGKLKGAAKFMDNAAASNVSLRNVGIPRPSAEGNLEDMMGGEEPAEGEGGEEPLEAGAPGQSAAQSMGFNSPAGGTQRMMSPPSEG
jgi:hypothetical protein